MWISEGRTCAAERIKIQQQRMILCPRSHNEQPCFGARCLNLYNNYPYPQTFWPSVENPELKSKKPRNKLLSYTAIDSGDARPQNCALELGTLLSLLLMKNCSKASEAIAKERSSKLFEAKPRNTSCLRVPKTSSPGVLSCTNRSPQGCALVRNCDYGTYKESPWRATCVSFSSEHQLIVSIVHLQPGH